MAPLTRITESELLDALTLATAGAGPAEARTCAEIVEETGIALGRVRKALKEAKRAGRLNIHSVSREALNGSRIFVAGYTITPASPPAKRRG